MTHPTAIETIDPAQYWTAATRADRLLELPGDDVTDVHREQFTSDIEKIDGLAERVIEGATTGTSILDRLVRSGQIIAPQRFKELEGVEELLVEGDPILVQESSHWKVGILSDDELLFSGAKRTGYIGANFRGTTYVPTTGFVDLHISPFMALVEGGIDKDNVEVEDRDSSSRRTHDGTVLMPLVDRYSGRSPFNSTHDLPQGMHDAYLSYMERARHPIGGDRVEWETMYHVGQQAVEANLGIALGEVLDLANSDAIRQYLESN